MVTGTPCVLLLLQIVLLFSGFNLSMGGENRRNGGPCIHNSTPGSQGHRNTVSIPYFFSVIYTYFLQFWSTLA